MFYGNGSALTTGILGDRLVQGVRADLILLGYLVLLPVLLAPLLAHRVWSCAWRWFSAVWATLAMVFLVFMELSSPQFIMQSGVRPNRLFSEYLSYPQEVLATLWNGFRIALVGGLVVTILLGRLSYRLMKSGADRSIMWSSKKLLLTWPLILVLVAMQIRSTTGHPPANPALSSLTGDAMVNSLIIISG